MARTRDALIRELRQALEDYAEHQSWRCGHPDRYPWDPDCPCGLVTTLEGFGMTVARPERGEESA